MATQDRLLSADHLDRDFSAKHESRDGILNASIVQADISQSFEEYLEIFDAFYADDIEVSSGESQKSIRGKASVRSILLDFLIPLHIMAEIGGLSVSLRSAAIPGDLAHETHSFWILNLVAPSGKTCTLGWHTFRKWIGTQVVCEHHFDHQQIGGPLNFNDLSLGVTKLDDSPPAPPTPDS